MENSESKNKSIKTDLEFNASKIAKLEKESGLPFLEVLGKFSLENINLFIKYGLDVDEETAYILINEYLKEKDITELYVLILEELQNKGFLPRTVNLKEILNKTQEQVAKM